MATIKITDVPIFDQHGDYTRADLEEIARNSQRRIDDTGDKCPLTLGHTPKRNSNLPDPPIVGYASNFHVGQFGKINPRACIYADFEVDEKAKDEVRARPRRSVELWPNDRIIDPIALLGSRTPQRDLGLLTFQRKPDAYPGQQPIRYEMGADPMLDAQSFMEVFMETPIGKFMQQLMDEKMKADSVNGIAADDLNRKAEELNGETGDEDEIPGEEITDEGEPLTDDVPADEPPFAETESEAPPFGDEDDLEKKKEPKKMARTETAGKPAKTDPKTEVLRMERDQLATKYAKLEAETKQLREDVAAIQSRARRAEREKAFIQLESEGFKFERADEMAYCDEMSPEQFDKHVARIRKCYQKAPVGARIYTEPMADGGAGAKGEKVLERSDLDKVYKFMKANKATYEKAVESVLAAG